MSSTKIIRRELSVKLFVCGAPRSGTSILTELLSSHPSVSLGMERFRKLYAGNVLSESHFQFEHFFSFPEDETKIDENNGQYIHHYKKLRQKYRDSAVVGDEMPDLFRHYGYLAKTFSPVGFIYIVRSVDAVASSWNRRAANPNDNWPSDNDAATAVKRWNDANRLTLNAIGRGVPITVASYQSIFEDNDETVRDRARKALFSACGLADASESKIFHRGCFEKLGDIKKRRSPLTASEAAYLDAEADMATYNKLLALSA